jgi:hypothetical protein
MRFVFGFMHLINNNLNFSLSVLFLIVVLPQIFTGCLLGYIRVRYRLGLYICIAVYSEIN